MRALDLRQRLEALLADAYTIERELEGGGMARVFVAEERAFERKVVVKVLPPEAVSAASARRFDREIRLAAGLQQANIVPLLTAGVVGGLTYYTMPYIDGASLRERLADGRIGVAEAVSVLRDVARALAFAHGCGVVHRDVKPGNVLLSSGTAVVTDFGIAKALDLARAGLSRRDAVLTLTQEDGPLGTPRYMAPEQCSGLTSEVDHRADIYAWGLLAYELLAGEHAFAHCRTGIEFVAAQLNEEPLDLRLVCPACPSALAALVMRCIEKQPRYRPASARELLAILDDAATAARAPEAPALARGVGEVPSIAVLPFARSGTSPDDDVLADGITEEILSALAHMPGIRVAARTSCFAFRGTASNPQEVGRQLGVRAVLEGSLRRVGTQVRATVQLLSAEDGLHLWSGRFDREMSDLLLVQDEIAHAVVETLGVALRSAARHGPAGPRRRSHARASHNVEAYEEYLRGRLHLDQRSTDVGSAIACFERAIRLDAKLSVAHSGLAHTYTWLALWYVLPATVAFARVREAADTALRRNASDAVALSAKAIAALWHDWNWPVAERLAADAIAAAPSLPLGHSVMTYVHITRGNFEAAVGTAEHAADLDRLSNAAKTDLADALRFAGRHEDARRVLLPVVEREPGHILANLWMAYQCEFLGDAAEAVRYVERAVAAAGRTPALTAALARQLAAAGREAEAEAVLAELHARARTEHVAAFVLAVATVGLRDYDATLRHLRDAVAARDPHVIHLQWEHFWEPLRSRREFRALLRTIGVRRDAAPRIDVTLDTHATPIVGG